MNKIFQILANLDKPKMCRIINADGKLIYQGAFGKKAKELRKKRSHAFSFMKQKDK